MRAMASVAARIGPLTLHSLGNVDLEGQVYLRNSAFARSFLPSPSTMRELDGGLCTRPIRVLQRPLMLVDSSDHDFSR